MRVNVYVDGFNLYHRALRDTRTLDGSTYKWLDLEKLAAQVLGNPSYIINRIRYFTARVRVLPGDRQAPLRQQMYLRALARLPLYKPIRLGAIAASLFPDALTDTKGNFRKPPTW